ncbi:MAG: cell wall metabolism sensor histidine kinase WalK [Defluviitaleaceae bacterium]|nr:cell wall metabolism sensor histidine kinase WalK [Defluviitaleaceae bacterium]
MKSIKLKLMILYAAVVFVVMAASGTFMLWDMRNMEIQRTQHQLRAHIDRINQQILQSYELNELIDAPSWAGHGDTEYDIQAMIMNEMGIPIAPSVFVVGTQRFNCQALISAIYGEEGTSVGRIGTDLQGIERRWIAVATPVTRTFGNNTEHFILYARVNAQFMYENLSMLALALIIMIMIALVLTLVFWFFLANTHINPIVTLTHHTKAIAEGDFSREIVIKSKDELGQLAYNFNHMARELQANLISMASEKNKQEAILQNTSHGVLAYDTNGNLIHANNASVELMSGTDIQDDTNLRELLETLGFDPEEIYELPPGEIREAIYDGENYILLACATTYTSEANKLEGFILVLQDITRQAKLENMRKEFVANVSHELKTPLTSIQAYTETLMEGAMDDPETATKFLKVINDETQRMTLLITDLLELSRIDSKNLALEMDVIDLTALLRRTIHQSQFLADQKNQKITTDSLDESCFIEANAARITQVVSNILSNSIKYSPENTKIHVSMEITEKFYRIFIQDQGMGIPQESLARIFERFYRVDKARARAMGGTGLGLAIVKEIMEEHGGRVYASSQFGEGTTMVLRFNRYEDDI